MTSYARMKLRSIAPTPRFFRPHWQRPLLAGSSNWLGSSCISDQIHFWTFSVKQHSLILLGILVLDMSVSLADANGPYMLTVHDVRELVPGADWDPSAGDVLVQVRGYLRDSTNL